MKKLVFSCLLILICAPLYPSSWWEGGPGRVMSLGWCYVALPDSKNINDLYDAGFVSSMLQREKKDVLSLGVGVYPSHYDLGTNTSNLLSFESVSGDENFDLLWLSPDSVIIIKPFLFTGSFSDAMGFSSTSTLASGEIQYAGAFDDKLSAGASIRYSGSMTGQDYPNGDSFSIGGGRFDLSADLGMKLGPGLFLGISAGNPTSMHVKTNDLIRELYGDLSSRGFRGYDGQATLTAKTTLGNPYTAVLNYHTNGVNIGAGIQYTVKDSVEAALSFGMTQGYSYVTDMTYQPWNDLYQYHDEGLPLHTDARWRSYIGENLVLGVDAGGSYYNASYKSITPTGTESGSYAYYDGHAALGAAYRNGSLNIPAEVYLTTTDWVYAYSRSINVCAGVEWKAMDWLMLRLGTTFPVARETVKGILSSRLYAVSGGLGLDFGWFLANLGARYYNETESRDTAYFPSDTSGSSGLDVIIDVKFLLPERAQYDAMKKNAEKNGNSGTDAPAVTIPSVGPHGENR